VASGGGEVKSAGARRAGGRGGAAARMPWLQRVAVCMISSRSVHWNCGRQPHHRDNWKCRVSYTNRLSFKRCALMVPLAIG
jgi:hypothetical protein